MAKRWKRTALVLVATLWHFWSVLLRHPFATLCLELLRWIWQNPANGLGRAEIIFASIWLVKWILQTIQINRICKNVGESRPSWIWHLVYEFYLMIVTLGTFIFFILPKKTVWKGRKY